MMCKLLNLIVLLFSFQGLFEDIEGVGNGPSSSEKNEDNYLIDIVDLSPSFSISFDDLTQLEEKIKPNHGTESLKNFEKYKKKRNEILSRRKRVPGRGRSRGGGARGSPSSFSKPKIDPCNANGFTKCVSLSTKYIQDTSLVFSYSITSIDDESYSTSLYTQSEITKIKSSSTKVSISPTWPAYGFTGGSERYQQSGYAEGHYPEIYNEENVGNIRYPGQHPGGYPGYCEKLDGFEVFIPFSIPIGYPGWYSERYSPPISNDYSVTVAVVSKNRLQIEENKRAAVTCAGNSRDSRDITWEKDNNVIDVVEGTLHVTKETQDNSSSLVFERTKLEHTGTYRCVVKIGKFSDVQKFVLNVIKSSEEKPNVTLIPSSETINLYVNQSYQVICNGNSPQVSWIDKMGQGISQRGGTPYELRQLNESVLVFNKVKFNEGGHYTCVVHKNGYNVTKSFVLEVSEFPKETKTILFPDEDHVIKFESQTYNVICNGNTTDSITWRDPHNNLITPKLDELDDKTIYTVVGQHQISLFITDVKVENLGHYTCNIYESAYKIKKSFFLDVKPLPRLKFIPDDDSIEIMKDEKYSVTCNGTNSTSNIMWFGPNDEIIFQKDPKITRRIYVTVGNNSVELHFDKMLLQNEGNYSCFANVNGTSIKRSLSVSSINYETLPKPHFTSDFVIIESKVVFYLNEKAEITCDTKRKDATVNWYSSSNVPIPGVSSETPQRIYVWKKSNLSNLLTIDRVMYTDSGTYKCISETSNQNATRFIYVTVIERVHFLPDFQIVSEVAVVENKNVSLFCGAAGEPTPRIIWYFQNKPIQVDNTIYKIAGDRLTVAHTTYLSAGKYTCKASQCVFGGTSEERNIFLKVLHAPVFPAGNQVTAYCPFNGSNFIKCDAIAVPPAIFSWYSYSSLSTSTFSAANQYLQVDLENPSDLDTLYCEAWNDYGQASQAIRIAEALQPPIIDIVKVTAHEIVYQLKTKMKTIISFKIKYYYKDLNDNDTYVVYTHEFYKGGTSDEEHIISNLDSGTKYVIQAASYSYSSGWTNFSSSMDVATTLGEFTLPNWAMETLYFVGFVALLTGVFACIVFAYYTCLKRR